MPGELRVVDLLVLRGAKGELAELQVLHLRCLIRLILFPSLYILYRSIGVSTFVHYLNHHLQMSCRLKRRTIQK